METTRRLAFQFHKVQLKAKIELSLTGFPLRFQFHKVQLKAQKTLDKSNQEEAFQFHKVQLKDLLMRFMAHEVQVSIP